MYALLENVLSDLYLRIVFIVSLLPDNNKVTPSKVPPRMHPPENELDNILTKRETKGRMFIPTEKLRTLQQMKIKLIIFIERLQKDLIKV